MSKKSVGCVWKLLIASFCLCALVLLVWLALPPYVERAISKAIHNGLGERLGVDVSVSAVDVALAGRTIGLYGLRIPQPPGFGEGDLLYAPELACTVGRLPIMSSGLVIDNVSIVAADVALRRQSNGVLNVMHLLNAPRADEDQDEQADDGPLLHIGTLTIDDCTVTYHEPTPAAQPIAFSIIDGRADVSDLRFGPSTDAAHEPGHLRATGTLRKSPFPDGKCGVIADVGALGGGLPTLMGCLRIVGFELGMLKPVLPPQTAAILGGDALDVALDLSAREDSLTGSATVTTIAGYRYDITLLGSPTDPTLEIDSDAVAYVLARSRGGLGNTVRNLGLAGKAAASGVSDAATGLATGAAKTVGSFGQGVVGTLKGVFTFNRDEIGEGTKEMGTAIAGGATDAVFGAGGQIVEGVGAITGSLTGDEVATAWREAVPDRWTNAWQDAIQTMSRLRDEGS